MNVNSTLATKNIAGEVFSAEAIYNLADVLKKTHEGEHYVIVAGKRPGPRDAARKKRG